MSSFRKEELHPGRNFHSTDIEMVENWKKQKRNIWKEPEMKLGDGAIARSIYICAKTNYRHGYLIVHKKSSDQIIIYEVMYDRKEYSIRKSSEFLPDGGIHTYLRKNHGLKITSTRLSDDQLNKLALWCKQYWYLWIRGDCMSFAKDMAKEIACNENNMESETWNELTKNLAVIVDKNVYQSSEVKSRRHPNYPKSYFMAFLSSCEKNFTFNHAMIALVIFIFTGAILCIRYIL